MRILYQRYKDTGLEILAFPCNNFAGQEPGSNEEILVCARGKGASFPILGKLECENGEKTHPLYQYLKASLDTGLLGNRVKWNFAKFLCDAEGNPVKRYLPTTSPLEIEPDILELIEKR